MADDRKKEKGSDRNRIKNITNLVRPDDEQSGPRRRGMFGASFKSRKAADRDAAKHARKKHDRDENTAEKADLEEIGEDTEGLEIDIDDELGEEEMRERRKSRKHHEESMKRRRHIRARRRLSTFAIGVAAAVLVVALVFGVRAVLTLNTGTHHDNKGLAAYNSGDYDTAVSEFKEAIAYDAKNAGYYIHLGMSYIEQQSNDEALSAFNQAQSCAENDSEKALASRGSGLACMNQGNYEEAVSAFDTALSYNESAVPDDLRKDILYYKADACEANADYEAAVEAYTSILNITDSEADALMKRGLAYEQLGDYTNAEKDLRDAINNSKKNYAVYMALYDALMQQDKEDDAKDVLNEALQLDGTSGEDLYYKGLIYLTLGNTGSAAADFESAYDKGYKAALIGEGEIAYNNQDYETAAADYEQYFKEADLDTEDVDIVAKAYNQYAMTLIAQGNYEDAVTACQNGLALNSREADAALNFNLIVAYEYQQDWENAYSAAKTYHEKYPNDEQGTHEFYFLESRMTN